jgi:hypothetical protein
MARDTPAPTGVFYFLRVVISSNLWLEKKSLTTPSK